MGVDPDQLAAAQAADPMTALIDGPAEVAELPVGQWTLDVAGTAWCLVDTLVIWSQRMWMASGGRSYVAVESMTYPLELMDIDEDDDPCPHRWGFQECGHCKRCGVVAGPVRELVWHAVVLGGSS